MEQRSPGPAPTDAYQWRESVLSTRSLSYISTVPDDQEGSPSMQMTRNPSFGLVNFTQTRRSTLMSISSLDEDDQDGEALEVGPRRRGPARDSKTQFPSTPLPPPPPPTMPSVLLPQQSLPASIASSPLFCLPRELRQIIWSYAISPSEASLEIPWPATHLSAHLQPQLLRTCKPIYQESAEILYTTTNLSFAHPSDANMFRRALASRVFAIFLPHFTLHIRSHDAKLWTNYFNSNSSERSLANDFPNLQSLTIRYHGLRWDRRYNEEQNAHLWLKDPRLQELVLSVRKCNVGAGPPLIRVALCIVLPDNVKQSIAECKIDPLKEAERYNSVILVREAWLLGCYITVESVEHEGLWR